MYINDLAKKATTNVEAKEKLEKHIFNSIDRTFLHMLLHDKFKAMLGDDYKEHLEDIFKKLEEGILSGAEEDEEKKILSEVVTNYKSDFLMKKAIP